MADLNRRDFLAAAATMAAACALCGSVAEADDKEWVAAKDLPAEKFSIGKPDDFTKDAGSDQFAVDHQVLVTRKDDKIVAMTAVCPHKTALMKVSDDGQYLCPRHGSRYTLEGVPTPKPNGRMGPAHEPLVHYGIRIDDDHKIIVDTGTTFNKDNWGDAAASVDIGGKK